MSEQEIEQVELPLVGPGGKLKAAREAAGLSRVEIAQRTRISERMIAHIEAGEFAKLPSRTYATGFTRSYARALGLDAEALVGEVRRELGMTETAEAAPAAPAFEPGDPARVPTANFAWIAALLVLLVVATGLAFWRSSYAPSVTLPSILPSETASADASQNAALPAPAAAPTGPVTFTATEDGIWVKFYDQAGVQLLQKELAKGESYTVPAEVQGPQLWTARPEALDITIGGQAIPRLSDRQVTMKDVAVSAEALLARGAAAAASASATSSATETPQAQRAIAMPRRTVRREAPAGRAPASDMPVAEPVAAPAAAPPAPSTDLN